jgi:hypothetical protein
MPWKERKELEPQKKKAGGDAFVPASLDCAARNF